MNRKILILSVVAAVIAISVGAEPRSETSKQRVANVDPASTVRECLEEVRRNIGGWCGTPDEEANYRLSQIGKPVVPFLIDSLKENRLPQIDRFIAETLSGICCYNFDPEPHDAVVAQVEEWWKTHSGQSEEDWIVDALGSGDSRRMGSAYYRAKRLTNPQDEARLVPLLKSEKEHVASNALYILWDNFQSEHAARFVREACHNGTKDRKIMALRLCEDRKITSLSPAVAEVLRKDGDYGVIYFALAAAKKMRASDCLPLIEKMDRSPSSKYPMNAVIEALAALKTTSYGDRVLHYLREGDRGERMAAAEVICDCVSAENAIKPLLAALKDPDINVRRYACISLGRAASDKSRANKLGEIVPAIIQLFRGKDDSSCPEEAQRALEQICVTYYDEDELPKVDGSLGGARLAAHALPIWKEWWAHHSEVR